MQTFTNKIIIECPQAIADYWSNSVAIANLFDGNNLTLRIPSTKYSPVKEGSGRNVQYRKATSNTAIHKDTIFIGFRVQIDDSREDLKLLIRELANYSVGNGECEATPINIQDYHYRHDRIDRDRGYRLRWGTFKGEISEKMGTQTEGFLDCNGNETVAGGYRIDGFGFKFMEVEPVGYF